MNFLYFYPLREDDRLRYDMPIHLMRPDDTGYLCGEPLMAGPHIKTKAAKPGLKLCEACADERKRLMAGKPSPEQMKNWWAGGLNDYRAEMTK
ncbi:MAG: hypothetical protein ACYSYU_10825 [Planctomycetota bacterium]